MSGGSMNHFYRRMEWECIGNIAPTTPERRAFIEHLRKVAKALHDIEWVDSGDYGPGDETEAIMACIRPVDVVEQLMEEGRELRASLEKYFNASDCRTEERGSADSLVEPPIPTSIDHQYDGWKWTGLPEKGGGGWIRTNAEMAGSRNDDSADRFVKTKEKERS